MNYRAFQINAIWTLAPVLSLPILQSQRKQFPMGKGLKILTTALCTVPFLNSTAHAERLGCLYENCNPAVLVPFDVNGFVNGQVHNACWSIDAHIRAIEYLLLERGNDAKSAPETARELYQGYSLAVMTSRNTIMAKIPVSTIVRDHDKKPRNLTPNEHVALVEDATLMICTDGDRR